MEILGRSKGAKYECLLLDFMLERLDIEEDDVPRMCLELYREHGTTMAGLKAPGYEFDDDEFHAYVHGKLPYQKLKPDPVLRNLLLSMPQRKIIFTDADKAHTSQVLSRLGLEDCFEGVICFKTLNPPPLDQSVDTNLAAEITTSRILCKPAVEAIEAAILIANADTTKTAAKTHTYSIPLTLLLKCICSQRLMELIIIFISQIFFNDSPPNIASGKAAGLHTVVVGSSTLVPGAE